VCILSVSDEDRLGNTSRGGGVRGRAINVRCAYVIEANGRPIRICSQATRTSGSCVPGASPMMVCRHSFWELTQIFGFHEISDVPCHEYGRPFQGQNDRVRIPETSGVEKTLHKIRVHARVYWWKIHVDDAFHSLCHFHKGRSQN